MSVRTSHGHVGEHRGGGLCCVPGPVELRACMFRVGVHTSGAGVTAGHTWGPLHLGVFQSSVRERVGRSLCCVRTCSPCASLPRRQPHRPPPGPACVVGASGPRGREAAASGCGQDGLDLFRLRRWERSGNLYVLEGGAAGALRVTPQACCSPGLGVLPWTKGVSLTHCEELGNYPILGSVFPQPCQNRRNHENFPHSTCLMGKVGGSLSVPSSLL